MKTPGDGGRFLLVRSALFLALAAACAGKLVAQSPPNFAGAGGAILTVLHTFAGAGDGALPLADLIQGNDGNFYGTTFGGGSDGYGIGYGDGTVFEITPAGVLTTLNVFAGGVNGLEPVAALAQASDGNFYGLTQEGGAGYGAVFEITPAGALTTLHTFTGGTDGKFSAGGLTLGNDGNFYGTTYNGDGHGTVFKITPGGTLTTIYAFAGDADGALPYGNLTLGSDGNFYGVTDSGGDLYGEGTVFSITPAGVKTTLHIFAGGNNGRHPYSGLIQAKDGNFYGTTYGGGGFYGTVYKITPGGVFTTLYAFTGGADGAIPMDALTQGKDGNFYGTTYNGGDSNGDGTIFEITPDGLLTTLYTFTGGADGANPLAGLTLGSDRTFYGTAEKGGQNGKGVVFRLTLPSPPAVTLAATVPQVVVGSGEVGEFTVSVPAPQSADVVVSYTIKGAAINGADYQLIKASKKIKAGQTSRNINIVPQGNLGGASKKTVALVLQPGAGYTVGTTGKVKVEILSAGQ